MMRSMLVLAGVACATVLTSCKDGLPSPTVGQAAQDRVTPAVLTADQVLDLLETAVLATIEDQGDEVLLPDRLFITGDVPPTRSDALRQQGLSNAEMARHVAARLNIQTRSRDDAIACEPLDPQRRILHSCHLTYDGAYYAPRVTRLAEDSATVSVTVMSEPGREAVTHIFDMARTGDGWKVVGVSYLAP